VGLYLDGVNPKKVHFYDYTVGLFSASSFSFTPDLTHSGAFHIMNKDLGAFYYANTFMSGPDLLLRYFGNFSQTRIQDFGYSGNPIVLIASDNQNDDIMALVTDSLEMTVFRRDFAICDRETSVADGKTCLKCDTAALVTAEPAKCSGGNNDSFNGLLNYRFVRIPAEDDLIASPKKYKFRFEVINYFYGGDNFGFSNFNGPSNIQGEVRKNLDDPLVYNA
jgi:hypothetical protein